MMERETKNAPPIPIAGKSSAQETKEYKEKPPSIDGGIQCGD